jgi:DNA-binding transcriptional LysR family regulator
MLAAACRTAGFEPRIGLEIEDIRAAHGLIAAGLGAAPIPDLAVDCARHDVEIRELTKPPLGRIAAMRLAGPESSMALTTMLASLPQTARGLSVR